VAGNRYRGSTKETNKTRAAAIAALKLAEITEGRDPIPRRAPRLEDLSKRFLGWIKDLNLQTKSKLYYRDGCRLLAATAMSKMRVDTITDDDIERLRFEGSSSTANCALRTLRRMLHKSVEWKLIRKVPKIRLMKEYGRSLRLDDDAERKLFVGAEKCGAANVSTGCRHSHALNRNFSPPYPMILALERPSPVFMEIPVPLFRRLKSKFYWYQFLVEGHRYRGSTRVTDRATAKMISRKKYLEVVEGRTPPPRRAPSQVEFADRFLNWVKGSNLQQKTKLYYRAGWRLLDQTRIVALRLNEITSDYVASLHFPGSPSNINCAIRTVRRMLHKAKDWNLIHAVPKVKLVPEYRRFLTLDQDAEDRLRRVGNQLLSDIVVLMRDTECEMSENFIACAQKTSTGTKE
jgi:hypothetical protein